MPRDYTLESGPNAWTRAKPAKRAPEPVPEQREAKRAPEVERAPQRAPERPATRKAKPRPPRKVRAPRGGLNATLVRFTPEQLGALKTASRRCRVSVAAYLRVLVDLQVR